MSVDDPAGADDDAPSRPLPSERTCPACGAGDLEAGYLEDEGEYSRGFVKWIAGPIVLGRKGRAKVDRRTPKWVVDAHRCLRCGHIALFAARKTY